MNCRHSRLAAACVLAACSLISTGAQAQSNSNGAIRPASKSSNLLRFFAVGGTLSSWAYAAWQGAPLTDCDGAHWQLRSQIGRDDELKQVSAGAAFGDCRMLGLGEWSLSHQTAVTVGRWNASGQFSGADSAWDVAVVPLLHWQHHAFGPHMVELEFGVGPAWLSEPHIGDRYKSTQFQFSDHLGVNLVGPADRWRVGLHWRHISNLDIRTPNNGVDFTGLVFALSL
jgi:hypothetical protein